MTDAALARRRALALASQDTFRQPAETSVPLRAELLRMGGPLVWDMAQADLRMWAAAQPATAPHGVRLALAAVLDSATPATAAALADAYDLAIEDTAAEDDDRMDWCEAADRCRLLAGLLGHVSSALIAALHAENAGMETRDDWERRALLTTAAELRACANLTKLERYPPRATARRSAWADLLAESEELGVVLEPVGSITWSKSWHKAAPPLRHMDQWLPGYRILFNEHTMGYVARRKRWFPFPEEDIPHGQERVRSRWIGIGADCRTRLYAATQHTAVERLLDAQPRPEAAPLIVEHVETQIDMLDAEFAEDDALALAGIVPP